MWLRKAVLWFMFILFVFLFLAMAVTACQAEEQAMQMAAAPTIAHLASVEIEKRIEVDKAEEQVEEVVVSKMEITEEETEAEPEAVVKLYYDVPLAYELQDYIALLCEEHHIDSAVVVAMIKRESNFDIYAVGDNGNSEGLMQIQKRWHSGRMDKLGCHNLFDPMQNVKVGIDYLAEMLDWYGGDIAKALTAYNRGSYSGYISEYATTVLATSEYLKEGMIEVSYLPDSYDVWAYHDAQQEKALAERPVCADCDQHIQEEFAFYRHGEWLCESCVDSYKRMVD